PSGRGRRTRPSCAGRRGPRGRRFGRPSGSPRPPEPGGRRAAPPGSRCGRSARPRTSRRFARAGRHAPRGRAGARWSHRSRGSWSSPGTARPPRPPSSGRGPGPRRTGPGGGARRTCSGAPRARATPRNRRSSWPPNGGGIRAHRQPYVVGPTHFNASVSASGSGWGCWGPRRPRGGRARGEASIQVYGASWCPDCRRAKRFLADQRVRFVWHDIEQDPEGQRIVQSRNDGNNIIPTIVFPDGSHLSEPTNEELADKLGLSRSAMSHVYDLIVVGGGPAGLTTSIYAARENLQTLVVDGKGLGGQAGVTERLDNYPGFPEGVGGAELADRIVEQARRHGVEMLQ